MPRIAVTDRLSYAVILGLAALCVVGLLLVRLPRAVRADDKLLGDDGAGYFSYLRSLAFDRDLDFRNEYTRLDWPYYETTSTGLASNYWSVGPALLWTPFFSVAHAASLMAHAGGIPADIDGHGYLYYSSICVGTIVYVTAGCFFTYRVCRRYFSAIPSLIAVASLWLASSLFHYTVAAAGSSHGVSFFAVSLFLFVWHPPRSRTYKEWVFVGLTAGLMALVRWQNLLYLSLLAVESALAITGRAGAGNRRRVLSEQLIGATIIAATTLLLFVPQAVAWNTLYGSPITVPQGGAFFDWLHPHLLEYLFSTNHGLYTWTPITLLASAGLAFLWHRDRTVTAALLTALFLQWYACSAPVHWWAHGSFGARRFISAAPLLALGMAALAQTITDRFAHGVHSVVGTGVAFVGWNLLFDLQYSLGFIPRDQAISLHQLTIGKFDMILELIRRALIRS